MQQIQKNKSAQAVISPEKTDWISSKDIKDFYPGFFNQLSATAWKLNGCIEVARLGKDIPDNLRAGTIKEIGKLINLMKSEPLDPERNEGTIKQLSAVQNDLRHNRPLNITKRFLDPGNTPEQNGFELIDAWQRCLSRLPYETVGKLEGAGMKEARKNFYPRA